MLFRGLIAALDRNTAALGAVRAALAASTQQGKLTMEKLTADIAANTTVTASVLALIGGLAAQIKEVSTDPAAVQALATQLESNTAALAAAVSANTPAPAPAPAAGQ